MIRKVSKMFLLFLLLAAIPFQTVSAASSADVVNAAKAQLGVRYVYGGTTPAGFDCSGFTSYIFRSFGIQLPRTSAAQYNVGTKVAKANLAPGDLVFFSGTAGKAGITHVGIYIGDNQFISATTSKGIKIDSLSSKYWGPKYVGATRVLTNAPGEFFDVSSSNPAYTAIKTLSTAGIINGFENGNFGPEQSVTRGQAAAIINRTIKHEPASLETFADVVPGSRFEKDIAAMKELGIMGGFADETFRPEATMTKAEMAAIVARAFKLQEVVAAASVNYKDVTPEFWAYDAIVAISAIDSTSVFAREQFKVSDNATRAEFATAIYNAKNATGR